MSTNKKQAYIVATVSQKGGTGKTAVNCQMAIELARGGLKTCIVDMDENQYSAAKMLTRRKNNYLKPDVPYFIATTDNLTSILKKIVYDFDIIFIESTGKITAELKLAISFADLILSPMEATEENTDTIPELENTLERFINDGIISPEIRAFIVPNKVPSQQRMVNLKNEDSRIVKMFNLSSELKYFKIAKNFIKFRPAIFPNCYSLGKGIAELKPKDVSSSPSRDTALSIDKAWKEFNNFINEVIYDK